MPAADPGRDPAVEHRDRVVPEVVEHPPQPRRHPAADVVIGDDEVLRRRSRPPPAERRSQPGSGRGWRPGPVGADQVGIDVEVDRPRAGARRRRPRRPSPGRPRYQRQSTMRSAGSPLEPRGQRRDRDRAVSVERSCRRSSPRRAQRSGVSPIGHVHDATRRACPAGRSRPGHPVAIPGRPGPRTRRRGTRRTIRPYGGSSAGRVEVNAPASWSGGSSASTTPRPR